MKLNFDDTQRILTALEDLIDTSRVTISTENKDWKGRLYSSDCVVLEPAHHICFENMDGEIIVGFFDDHTHFYRDASDEAEGEARDHVQDTITFLRRLFTTPLVKHETYQGSKRIRYQWFFLHPDGRKDSLSGVWIEKVFTNPFRKKRLEMTHWRYHRELGTFVQAADDTTSLHKYDWDILIHIRRSGNAYTFDLERYFFDEEETENYYWYPVSLSGKSLFDTEEKALAAAREAAKQYQAAYPHRSPLDRT